jgi:hypothetical protein
MKVSHSEGLANHSDPASWRCSRKGALQALTGERVGRVSSRENLLFRGADVLPVPEGHTASIASARYLGTPRGPRPLARTEASCTEPGRSCHWPAGNRLQVRTENPKGVQP